MQSSKVNGIFFNNLYDVINVLSSHYYEVGSSRYFYKIFGYFVNIFSNRSLAQITQCKVSSGNIFNVQNGISTSSTESTYDPYDSV